jgi:hypothetical protein
VSDPVALARVEFDPSPSCHGRDVVTAVIMAIVIARRHALVGRILDAAGAFEAACSGR